MISCEELDEAVQQITKHYKYITVSDTPQKRIIPFLAFHQYIVDGCIDAVSDILSEITCEEYKDFLMNTPIENPDLYPNNSTCQYHLTLPLCLAAASGNKEMLQLLFTHGANVTLTDKQQYNILHCLVELSTDYPQKACTMYQNILQQIGDTSVIRDLHNRCNTDGLTALELAAELCAPEILQLFLKTDDVYRFPICKKGLHTKYEYRIPFDKTVTFLHRIVIASKTEIDRFCDVQFFTEVLINNILTQLFSKYKIHIAIMVIMSTVIFLLYQVYLWTYLVMQSVPPKYLTSLLLCATLIAFVMELVPVLIFTQTYGKNKTKRSRRSPYVRNAAFSLPPLIFWFSIILICVIDFIDLKHSPTRNALHSFTAACSMGAFLYFFQLSTSFSYITLMMSKMLVETIKFFIFSGLTMMVFTLSSFVLSVAPKEESDFHLFSNQTENTLLFEFMRTSYDTFITAIAGKTPDDVYFSDSAVPALSMVYYLCLILQCPILLLNLLIAIFNHRVDDIYKYKEEVTAIMKIYHLLYIRNNSLCFSIMKGFLFHGKHSKIKDGTLFITIVEKNEISMKT